MRIFSCLLMMCLLCSPVLAEVQAVALDYEGEDGVTLKGYLAYDDAVDTIRPGILVVHEWWGHNEYVKKRAEQLAAAGYVAFALDMYGDGKTADHPDQAGAFAKAATENIDQYKTRFMAALNLLKEKPMVDSEKIIAIGYCFGGSTVLNMARMGVDLDAVVSFHGSLTSAIKAQPGDVKAKVLVFTGADDVMVPQEVVDEFKNEMQMLGVDYRVVAFEGAKHSFTNPEADKWAEQFDLPLAYNREADESSWAQMISYFDRLYIEPGAVK